jgi:hypothetical protein
MPPLLQWMYITLVLGYVHGAQYPVCGQSPTSFSPKCDLGRQYILDDHESKAFTRCKLKTCDTEKLWGELQKMNPHVGSVSPRPTVLINSLVTVACK